MGWLEIPNIHGKMPNSWPPFPTNQISQGDSIASRFTSDWTPLTCHCELCYLRQLQSEEQSTIYLPILLSSKEHLPPTWVAGTWLFKEVTPIPSSFSQNHCPCCLTAIGDNQFFQTPHMNHIEFICISTQNKAVSPPTTPFYQTNWWFLTWGVPPNHPNFNKIFPYKPFIVGYPHDYGNPQMVVLLPSKDPSGPSPGLEAFAPSAPHLSRGCLRSGTRTREWNKSIRPQKMKTTRSLTTVS